MTAEPPPPSSDPDDVPGAVSQDDPVGLLVHAVGQLPAAQRDLVLAWLLRERPAIYRHQALREMPEARRVAAAAGQPDFGPVLEPLLATASLRAAGATGQQVVPVRFPAEQHAQLRDWCSEHGFSMATVIRGLVARFLEGQQPAA